MSILNSSEARGGGPMTAFPPEHGSNSRRPGSPLRIALIGCGKMGQQHLRAIRSLENTVVVGIADPSADRSTLAELVSHACLIVSDPVEMIRQAAPDVVHVVTPPGTHAELAMLALEAGCHVYVEKPFVPTRAEAEVIFALAASRGLQVCAGHQYLYERPSLLALEYLASIGRLVHLESYFSFRMVRRTITPVDQAKDILPHAVYPAVEQLRQGTGSSEAAIQITGVDARASGDVYALLRLGDATAIVLVTLSGRPVEQYQHLCGTNGWMRADYVTGGVTRLLGPGAGLGILFTPYRRAVQTLTTATSGFSRLILGRKTSYPGLQTLLERFYASVRNNTPPPLSPRSIIDTVEICERIGEALDRAERLEETEAQRALAVRAAALPPTRPAHGIVLVTGGTGLLGKRVAEELRHAGFAVRALGRRLPPCTARVPGVDYIAGDLASSLDASALRGVTLVVHCAAETAGGQSEHERNSIAATRHIIEAAAGAGVRKLVHISSLAVLKTGRQMRGPLSEQTPVDAGTLGRGPYVWGKAESEILAQRMGAERGLDVKVVRPGPLVDYTSFHPPGRLGREIGPLFVAVGGRRSPLSVCDVGTAARVIRRYVENFDSAPALLNLVEAPPPTRRELADRLRADRPDLRIFWFPPLLLRILSRPLKLVQRIALGSSKPIDVYAAFASERYQTDLAASVIDQAGPSVIRHRSTDASA
jgi:predicted dehydrogenase/nucleoside-diphosphate-sugar epimerase